MSARIERPQYLLSIAVAVIIVIIVGLAYIGTGVWVAFKQPAPEAPRNLVQYPDQSNDRIPGDTRFMGLPPAPDCAWLYNKPGFHRAWADCMGVGYDDSPADKYLYEHRDEN